MTAAAVLLSLVSLGLVRYALRLRRELAEERGRVAEVTALRDHWRASYCDGVPPPYNVPRAPHGKPALRVVRGGAA